jgi:hypothetical protein
MIMRGRLSSFLLVLASAGIMAACTQTTFAVGNTTWTPTSGGTFDWNNTNDWSTTYPGLISPTLITNDLSSSQLITNMGGGVAVKATNTINSLILSNGLGSASVTVQQATGVYMVMSNGFQLGKNATLVVVTNTSFGGFGSTFASGAMTFNLRAGGAGTLILSNASATAGFSTFVNTEGGVTNGISNQGTIQFNPNGNQLVSINTGQVGGFTNDALGTIVMNGTGTGGFIGNFSSRNISFVNSGSIFVQAGTFRIDSRDAFSRGGFQNTSTGYVQVNTNATFELRRTTNSWLNGPAVTNLGTVFMNGGTMLAMDLDQNGNPITTGVGATNSARVFANLGTIEGNGKISASLTNLSGSTLAPGLGFQTLNVGGGVSLGSNSTFSVELGLSPGQTDLLNVSGNLSLDPNSILSLSGGAFGNIYTVAVASAVSGTFGSVTPDYIVTYDPTDIKVQFIPEPSTMLLVIAGLGGIVAFRRRR